ncbi:MAG: phosphatidylglycerol lysyltransferase domain-containing protein [Oscillospiraceae bacterium]|nr:phosphatidylglycerol lysyltransferase domain-containing protein [Oscillospiraceae bacterium]MDD4414441.1 phosphatidylglycerol lysyltransferase domain-containing protein [Oscillospiraceae bacterium]
MLTDTNELVFKEPTIDDAVWAAPMLRNAGMKICEFSFNTIWIWRKYYGNKIARAGDVLFIRSGDVEPLYLLPVGGDMRRNIEFLQKHQHDKGEQLMIFGADADIKEQIENWFPSIFDWEPSEADFDYIYNTEDLAFLKGKKYHSKRNHIAAFSNQYDWSYETIDENNADEVFDMVTKWCHERGNCSDPGLRSERNSIKEALKNMSRLSMSGGLIRVGGNVVAMTLGSPISGEIFDIHAEKALSDFSGAYAVINREFAEREIMGRYPLINRENDVGVEGLRRAKKSYRPVQIIEKYLASEKVIKK